MYYCVLNWMIIIKIIAKNVKYLNVTAKQIKQLAKITTTKIQIVCQI